MVFEKGEYHLITVSFDHFIIDGNAGKQINGYVLKPESYNNHDDKFVEADVEDDNSI